MNRKKTIDYTVTRRPRDSYGPSSSSKPRTESRDQRGRGDGDRDKKPFWKDDKNVVSLCRKMNNQPETPSYINDNYKAIYSFACTKYEVSVKYFVFALTSWNFAACDKRAYLLIFISLPFFVAQYHSMKSYKRKNPKKWKRQKNCTSLFSVFL